MADTQRRLYRVTIPIPNKTLADWLKGPRCRELVESRTAELFAVYEAMLPVRTERLDRSPAPGHLKRSAYYRVGRGGWGAEKDRWVGWVGNTADYAAILEWGSSRRNITGRHDLTNAAALLGYGREREFAKRNKKGDPAKLRKTPPRSNENELTPRERRALLTEDRKARREAAKAKAERNRELRAAGLKTERRATSEERAKSKKVEAAAEKAHKEWEQKRAKSQKLTRSEKAALEHGAGVREVYTAPEESSLEVFSRLDPALVEAMEEAAAKYDENPKSVSPEERRILKEFGLI